MLLLFLSFFSFQCFAQTYETVVEDIVFNSSSRIVLTQDMIEKSQARDIPSLLATSANISITSSPFQPTSISIRGGDSGHVLIIVDGIPFYDPSTIQRTGNLSALNIKSVKKIEIFKGSQSVLYGGQALGGVIKIETLPDQDTRNYLAELGTQSHIAGGAEYSENNILARGYYTERKSGSPKKGSSATYAQDQQNIDLGYRWENSTEGFVKASYVRDHSFSPSSDAFYNIVDVKNFELLSEQGFLSGQVNLKDFKWNPRLTFGLQSGARAYDFPLSSLNPFPIEEDYQSHYQFLRLDLRPFKSDTLTFDLGLNYSFEDFVFKSFNVKEADNILEQRGAFAKITSVIDQDTNLTYGARIENWTQKDPVTVYQIGFSHKKTKAEVSTGYKAPSLYQLHSNYGNPDLKEEKGVQYSLTQDFALGISNELSLTLFYSRFDDLISTTGTFPAIRYVNINKTETRGAEVSYSQKIATGHSIIVNLGYQEPKDLSAHQWLPRRPLANASVRYLLGDQTVNGSAELVAVGPRIDNGPTGRVKISGYLVANLGLNLNLRKADKIYFRIDNIAGSRYEETYGYFAEGPIGVVGLSSTF